MFTWPLNILLIFMLTTPIVGWVTHKKGYRKFLGVYTTFGLSVATCFLYELYKDVPIVEKAQRIRDNYSGAVREG